MSEITEHYIDLVTDYHAITYDEELDQNRITDENREDALEAFAKVYEFVGSRQAEPLRVAYRGVHAATGEDHADASQKVREIEESILWRRFSDDSIPLHEYINERAPFKDSRERQSAVDKAAGSFLELFADALPVEDPERLQLVDDKFVIHGEVFETNEAEKIILDHLKAAYDNLVGPIAPMAIKQSPEWKELERAADKELNFSSIMKQLRTRTDEAGAINLIKPSGEKRGRKYELNMNAAASIEDSTEVVIEEEQELDDKEQAASPVRRAAGRDLTKEREDRAERVRARKKLEGFIGSLVASVETHPRNEVGVRRTRIRRMFEEQAGMTPAEADQAITNLIDGERIHIVGTKKGTTLLSSIEPQTPIAAEEAKEQQVVAEKRRVFNDTELALVEQVYTRLLGEKTLQKGIKLSDFQANSSDPEKRRVNRTIRKLAQADDAIEVYEGRVNNTAQRPYVRFTSSDAKRALRDPDELATMIELLSDLEVES